MNNRYDLQVLKSQLKSIAKKYSNVVLERLEELIALIEEPDNSKSTLDAETILNINDKEPPVSSELSREQNDWSAFYPPEGLNDPQSKSRQRRAKEAQGGFKKEEALETRALNCKYFEWSPGMRAWFPSDVVGGRQYGRVLGNFRVVWDHSDSIVTLPTQGIFPELSDSATTGILLSLVRKATFTPNAWTAERDGTWYVCWSGATHGGDFGRGKTEVEAIISSLEFASKNY